MAPQELSGQDSPRQDYGGMSGDEGGGDGAAGAVKIHGNPAGRAPEEDGAVAPIIAGDVGAGAAAAQPPAAAVAVAAAAEGGAGGGGGGGGEDQQAQVGQEEEEEEDDHRVFTAERANVNRGRTCQVQMDMKIGFRLGNEKIISWDDIVGVDSKGSLEYEITLYTFPKKPAGSCSSKPTLRKSVPIIITLPTKEVALQWKAAAWKKLLTGFISPERANQLDEAALGDEEEAKGGEFVRPKMLVLVNPASGAGHTARIADRVRHVFEQAKHLDIEFRQTQYADHAKEIAQGLDLDVYCSVVTISGDGLLYEVVNGLMARPDWDKAVEAIALGIVPGGSGNGLAKSILHASNDEFYDPVNAAVLAVKGSTRRLDLLSVEQPGEPMSYGFLSLSWAIVADIDLDSEYWRCCGSARFTWTGIVRVCCLKKYPARLSILPPKEPVRQQLDPAGKRRRPLPECPKCINSQECEVCRGPTETQDLKRFLAERKDGEAKNDDPEEEARWEVVEDDKFTMLWAMNVAWGAHDMYPTPMAHLSDGLLDLTFKRDAGRCSTFGSLIGLEDGSVINGNALEYAKCKAVRLEIGEEPSKQSAVAIDGERMPYKNTEVRVWRGILRIISR